jgi:antirestriction protein ArdC
MQHYPSRSWLTFKQALDCGGNVRKGEHGTQIAFYKTINYKTEDSEGSEKSGTYFLMRGYTVFNADQYLFVVTFTGQALWTNSLSSLRLLSS